MAIKNSLLLKNHPVIAAWLARRQPSEMTLLIVTGLFVGLTSGIGVWVFKRLIDLAQLMFISGLYARLQGIGNWTILLIPVAGGLVVGWIIYRLIGEERHHGVAGIMEAAALSGGRLRYRRMPAKALASALSIGSGASVGPEDPSVQLGANLGSMFGQWLHLSDERVRSLVAAGAASGIAAAFNAPIAGVFFALEIILGEISGSALGIVVLAAVISAVFTQAVSGAEPAFHVPAYAFGSPVELPLYLGLGLLAGPVSALYVYLLYAVQDLFHHQINLPGWAKPALAGLMVGLVGIFLPQVLGVGYETIGNILSGQDYGFWLLIALLFAKLILTPVSIGGGFLGGVFAPSLFIGAALGGVYGQVLAAIFPNAQIAPGAYAIVGMAAVLAGAVHAPLTALILLFEMTNDYHIILPLMFAVIVSLLTSQRLMHDSVYTLGLARKGVRLQHGRDLEVLQMITVAEIMQPAPEAIRETDPLSLAEETLMQHHHHGLPVLNASGDLVGVFTIQDLDQARETATSDTKVGEVCTRAVYTASPSDTIGNALQRMGTLDIGRMPVVESNQPTKMIGWLRRTDLIRAYDLALTKRAITRHRAHQVRLGSYGDGKVKVYEVPIQPHSACDGKRVGEISWPSNCLVASLRHRRQVLIPHGDTMLYSGDVLVVVLEGDGLEQVNQLCFTIKTT